MQSGSRNRKKSRERYLPSSDDEFIWNENNRKTWTDRKDWYERMTGVKSFRLGGGGGGGEESSLHYQN